MICLPNAAQEILVKGMEQETDDEMSSSYTTESNRNSYAEDDSLNSDISPKEVTESIDHLKANKAAGLDRISQRLSNTLVTKLYLFLCTFLTQYLHQMIR